MENVLEVERLSIAFTRYVSAFRQKTTPVMEDVTVAAKAGEMTAVFGASGSGKSLLAHAVLGLLPEHATMSGSVRFLGEPLDDARLARLRGKDIVLVPQSTASLDPLMRVGAQVRLSVPADKRREQERKQRELFRRFGLAERVERLYPHELSGGMARRVLVATAAVSRPKLVVADEPTPGLHARDVREVLLRFREMADAGSAVLLITHDLEAALTVADKVVVMYAGTVVEEAVAADFSGDGSSLRHPYSRALWHALPGNGFVPVPGAQPRAGEAGAGCRYAGRCALASPECAVQQPEPRDVRGGIVRCVHAT